MTIDEAVMILETYINWRYCDELDAVPLKDWLTKDIVRMIELLDAELQQRADDDERYRLTVGEFDDWSEDV